MDNLLSFVKNVRTVYDRFYQKNVKEVEVQFQNEDQMKYMKNLNLY